VKDIDDGVDFALGDVGSGEGDGDHRGFRGWGSGFSKWEGRASVPAAADGKTAWAEPRPPGSDVNRYTSAFRSSDNPFIDHGIVPA
jgi:hypothetical protein